MENKNIIKVSMEAYKVKGNYTDDEIIGQPITDSKGNTLAYIVDIKDGYLYAELVPGANEYFKAMINRPPSMSMSIVNRGLNY